jgi:hypothetical protein
VTLDPAAPGMDLEQLLQRWREETWATTYVHYYQLDKTALLLDAVRPLFARLAGIVPRAYFVRHWRFGPHLRLRFGTDPATYEATVRPLVAEIIGRHLAAAPSRVVVDETELLRQHRRLAQLESERGELSPYQPDNSIRHSARAPLGSDPDDERVQRALADFYVDTTPLAFRMLATTRAGDASKYDLAVDLMAAVAHAMYPSPRRPGITEGFVSFRSHAEAYLAMVPERDAVRAHFEGQYRRFAPGLVGRVRRTVAALDAGLPPTPLVGEWLGLARPHIQRARLLIEAGELLLPFPHRASTGRIGWDDEWVGHSRFHTLINNSETYLRLLFQTPWFQEYRMALNLMYLHLNRIGVLPVERYLLCHLIANAVEEAYGVRALDLARRFAASGA